MQTEQRILAARGELDRIDAVEAGAVAFLPSILCSVPLPRRRVEGLTYQHSCGRASLSIHAGESWEGGRQLPVPFGPIPRSILAFICTQFVKRRTRDIWMGSSAAEFLRMIGKQSTGGHAADPTTGKGARGGYAALHLQTRALVACKLILAFDGQVTDQPQETKIIEHFEAWRRADGNGKASWSPSLQLTPQFADLLQAHTVPFDLRAMLALNRTAMAMDVYAWLAYRLCRVDKPTFLAWGVLRKQFGQEFGQLRDFKREMKTALRRALAVYPAARVSQVNGGIQLRSSLPPVSRVFVNKPVGLTSYPRDITPHPDATSPPTLQPERRDITPHLIPLAVSFNKTDSRQVVAVDKQAAEIETPSGT